MLLLNGFLCVINSLSCPSGPSIDIILDLFCSLFFALKVRVLSLFHGQLRLGSLVAQCSYVADLFCFRADLAFNRLTTSCGALGKCAVFAHQMRWMVLFWSIDHCIMCCLCSWVRCWISQDINQMAASCIVYVKVGTLDRLEQDKICVLSITTLGIAILTIQCQIRFSVCFINDCGDFLTQTSPDIFSIEECPSYIVQTWDFGCHSLLFICVTKHTK